MRSWRATEVGNRIKRGEKDVGEAASRAWRGKASVEGGGLDGWTD